MIRAVHALHSLAIVSVLVFMASSRPALGQVPATEPDFLDVPEYYPEEQQLTEQKIPALANELERLRVISEIIRELGKPTEKTSTETTGEYLDRVDTIMKSRGLAVHLLHQQLEKALDAKFQLEAQIDEYEDWVERLAEKLDAFPKQYRERDKQLAGQMNVLGKEAIYLAQMLYDQAQGEGNADEAERYQREFTLDALNAIDNRAALEKKYTDSSSEEIQAAFRTIQSQLVDAEYERSVLTSHAILEAEELAEILPQEHLKMVREARDLLNRSKDIEDRAVQVSIVSKYVFDFLKFVNPYKDVIRRRLAIRQATKNMPQIDAALQAVVSEKVEPVDRRGVALRAIRATAENEKEPR